MCNDPALLRQFTTPVLCFLDRNVNQPKPAGLVTMHPDQADHHSDCCLPSLSGIKKDPEGVQSSLPLKDYSPLAAGGASRQASNINVDHQIHQRDQAGSQ